MNKILLLGILPLSTHYAIVLFDTGASHSFISAQFAKDNGFAIEEAKEEWQMHLLSGETISMNQICKDCKVEVQDWMMAADLIVIEMNDFDVIFGMNWLSRNYAFIDCRARKVIFKRPHFKEFYFQGTSSRAPVLINAIQAKKLMKEDCQAYVISVQEENEDTPRLEDVPIVREYPEVFPEELPGLPPIRELDFGIELVAGTQPISKAPY